MHWTQQLSHFLERTYFHNTVSTWGLALAAVLSVITTLRVLQAVIVYRLRDRAALTPGLWDDIVLDVASRTKTAFKMAMGVAVATYILDLPHHWDIRIRTAVTVIAILQAGWWATGMGEFAIIALLERRGDPQDPAQRTGRNMLRFFLLAAVWALCAMLVLENIGANVKSLAAGLGVTGIAVALATQNIVGDLFASISILLDKPFLVGDYIIVDNFQGTVEKIGIKTTRVRSLTGEGLILANSDLTKSRLRNYKTLRERRIQFQFGIRYETPLEVVKLIPNMVRESIEQTPKTRFDRAELLLFGESALTYEVVYYVLEPAYNTYTSVQQSINYAMLEKFAKANIQFAFRTQVSYSATDTYLQDLKQSA